MAVKEKGKDVATPSLSKRKASSSAAASKRRRSGVLQFVDDAAYVAEDDEEEEEDDLESDEDFDELLEEIAKEAEAPVDDPKGKGKSFLPFSVKEEQLSGDELEELIKERYGRKSGLKYASDEDEFMDMAGPDPTKDPTIWRLKCGVGRERQVAFCFMQKYVEFHNRGNKLQIYSAFALDHVKGYVYVEADKACDVTEACKGFCNVYVTRINAVPASEVPHLLAIRSKPSVVSEGDWVRLKSGKYKGDIAKVVSVDDERKKVLIKLIPRIDLQAISQKFGGAISLKNASIPTARLINPRELEVFRPHIDVRRDRQSGETFEVLDGNMLKDGYLFKWSALNSLIYWGVEPTDSERIKFSPPSREGEEADPEEFSGLYDSRRKKSRASTSANLKASTSELMEDSTFAIHDLVLYGKKDFGIILGIDKDGLYKILTGDMEGIPVVTIKKHEIKKVCADKMFTALDRNKKSLSINDPVDVSEGPTEGKKGVVKHMFKGVLFIHDESEDENSGFFCAKAEHCVNTKIPEVPPPPMQSFSENPDDSAGPSFPPSSDGWVQSSCQQDNARGSGRRRQERESLFSIGQTLRIKKGPLKGYLCRVVRMYRNDITVKLDSLVKLLTVDAEHLTVSTKRGQVDESGAAGAADIFGVQGTEGGSSWDTALPSFASDTWQPFSSSTAPTSGNVEDGAGGDGDLWGSKAPSTTIPDAWNSDKPSDTWGNTSDAQAAGAGASTQNGTWQKDDDSGWCNEKGKDAVSDDPWGTAVSKVPEGADAWGTQSDTHGKSKGEADIEGWNTAQGSTQDASSNWDAKGKGIANEDNSAWGAKVTKSQEPDTWGGKSDAWGQSTEKDGGGGGWNSGGNASWDKPNSSTWNSGQDDGDKGNKAMDTWNSGGGFGGNGGSRGGGSSGRGGGRSGGGGDCYKCGQSGHFARECPSAGSGGSRGGGSGNCFKCGESGHFARECPSTDGGGSRSGGGGGGGNCFKCGQSGHFSRECPSADHGGSRGGGSGAGNCYKCGESGHFARECPSAEGGGSRGGGGGGGRDCFKCGESGHFARECPSADGGGSRGGGGGGGRDCFKCGKPGHFARECPGDSGACGGTWKSDNSEKPSLGSSWSNDQAGDNTWGKNPESWSSSGKGWGNSQAEAEKKTNWGLSSWGKDVSGKETTGGADNWNAPTPAPEEQQGGDNWNAPTPPAPEEPQGGDPWAGNLTQAQRVPTTNAGTASTEDKAKQCNSWDNNQKTEENDPWGSNQKTEASSSKAEAKGADPWSTKPIHDTGGDNQDDPWGTKKMNDKKPATDTGGWSAGGSGQTQSDKWGMSGNDSEWSKPRVSLTGGNNDNNNNDGSGWGRPSWSSDGGGRGRGRGRGRNFSDRNDSNDGDRGGNWRGSGGGQYGGSRGGRGGRDSTRNGDGNRSFNGSSWNRDENRGFGGSGGSSWSNGNDVKKSSDWGGGWGNTGGENEKGSSWNDAPRSTEKGSGWGNAGEEKMGNSGNGEPSSSAWNQGSTEKVSSSVNAGQEEKVESGGGGGSAWDKPSGNDSGGWDKAGSGGGNSGGW